MSTASIDLAMDKASRGRHVSMHHSFEGVPADLLTLAELKTMLLHRVATDAEAARLNHITTGSGKAMSYTEKAAEARLILDDESNPPPAEAVPILSREAAVRGLSLLDMARLVMTRYLAFKDAEAAINEAEVRAVMSISSASDAAEAKAAYEAVTWPLMR